MNYDYKTDQILKSKFMKLYQKQITENTVFQSQHTFKIH